MEQEQQTPLRDFNAAMNIGLSALFAVNRTVQIWSRAPGTSGTWFFAVYFVAGSMIQTWYCQVNEEVWRPDLIPQSIVMGASLFWFSLHGIAHTWLVFRGQSFHSYEPGIGILNSFFPNWSGPSASLGSDLIVSLSISVLLLFLQSPILSGWYASLCMWLLVSHYWLVARDARRRQQWVDSQSEAEHWSEQIKRSSR